MFNEAEQAADTEPVDGDDSDVPSLPDTGLPELDKPEPGKRGRKPLPADLPRERSSTICPKTRRAARAAARPCIAWALKQAELAFRVSRSVLRVLVQYLPLGRPSYTVLVAIGMKKDNSQPRAP